MTDLETAVEEFTTPNPVTAFEETPLEELMHMMDQHGIRHVPIVRGNEVVGVVSERDTKVASGLSRREKWQIRAGDIMSGHPVTVNAGASLDEVALEMVEKRVGSVIVNDEEDRLLGIFTVTDALNALIEITRSAKAGTVDEEYIRDETNI